MPLFILGVNHNTAPINIRENFVISEQDLPGTHQAVQELPGLDECVILSTCNRTEFICSGDRAAATLVEDWLVTNQNQSPSSRSHFMHVRDTDAARHLFRVCCGLDSVVVGEPQISGQLKDAYRLAESAGSVKTHLHRLFRFAFTVSKKVRTETAIGANPVSVAYAAVSLARTLFAGFKQHTALLVGAGETIELVAEHLHARGIGRLFVANRSMERARTIAHKYGGYAFGLTEIGGLLPEADILITSTAAEETLISLEMMSAAVDARRHKPVFAADIAVPRDIDDRVSTLDDVYVYTVDDLHSVISEGQQSRKLAAKEADAIIETELLRYENIERRMQAAPIIKALRAESDETVASAVQIAKKRLRNGENEDEILEHLARSIANKLMHKPRESLNQAAEQADEDLLRAASRLFGLDIDD